MFNRKIVSLESILRSYGIVVSSDSSDGLPHPELQNDHADFHLTILNRQTPTGTFELA